MSSRARADSTFCRAMEATGRITACESTGARRTLRKLRARTVSDLAIANAFFKPGPALGGMAGSFVRRYRGEEAVAYLHPALAPILGATQGSGTYSFTSGHQPVNYTSIETVK